MRAPASLRDPETLAFAIDDGPTHDAFFRRGAVAAHLVLGSGEAPRIVVAFPAGNTGAGVWFEPLRAPAALTQASAIVPVECGGGLRGVRVTLACEAPELVVRGAVLGSVRALRRFGRTGELPEAFRAGVEAGPPLVFSRTTIDGRRRIVLEIAPEGDTAARADGDRVALRAPGGPLRFTITALADDPPLTPIATRDLLLPGAADDARSRAALAFLAYEEKLCAGSWRFLTYFGRDTLLTLKLLAPVLAPAAMEAGLGSVLDRLSARGDVAHEEAIGEEAAVQHLAAGGRLADLREPVLDHGMIDDDFLLAPVAADYLAGVEPERARAFLARRTPAGETYAAALAKNLGLVMRRAQPFAETPGTAALIALPEGRATGDWRDSEDGLGGGRVPFCVSGALVPAALAAAAKLLASPLLGSDVAAAMRALRLAEAHERAADLFEVRLPHDEARRRLAAYGASIDVDPAPALAAIEGDVSFPALALDAAGAPIPVMHSDDGFVLLFGRPSPAALEAAARRILRPFPAGLSTPVGVVVANPAFAADEATRARFTAGHYHGTVIWSWQQAMLAAGLDRQLARTDLPPPARTAAADARRALGEMIRATAAWRTAELWSFAHRGGQWDHVPFGAARGHHTESNAAQLWSTVYLAIQA
jgi:hypothetical protein